MSLPELPKLDCTPHVCAATDAVGASSVSQTTCQAGDSLNKAYKEEKPGQEASLMENI